MFRGLLWLRTLVECLDRQSMGELGWAVVSCTGTCTLSGDATLVTNPAHPHVAPHVVVADHPFFLRTNVASPSSWSSHVLNFSSHTGHLPNFCWIRSTQREHIVQ